MLPEPLSIAGSVTLSIEVELGWGQHDHQHYQHLSERRREETEYLENLLAASDDYDIPITFDIVGHLFEDSCSGVHDGPHTSEWFGEDPGTSVEDAPLFYAPDMIQSLRSTAVDHELASHTYSHIICDEVSPRTQAWEFEQSINAHRNAGLDAPTSLVPPRHGLPDSDTLTQYGFKCIRQPHPDRESPESRFSVLRTHLFGAHPQHQPEIQDGIVRLYSTAQPTLTAMTLAQGQTPPHPVYRLIPRRIRQELHYRYLTNAVDWAIETDSHVHFWTHLFNLSNEEQWPIVERFLAYLAKQRREAELDVMTMSAVAERITHD